MKAEINIDSATATAALAILTRVDNEYELDAVRKGCFPCYS